MCKMTKPTRLNDVFSDWLTGGGIFSTLQNFPVPWKNENISISLDLEYHGNVSGEKIISPLVQKIRSGNTLTETEKTMLATSILAVCGVNWGKLWKTMSFEYNPIENYRMVENMVNDETVTEYGKSSTRTDNLIHKKTGTETADIDETDTRTDNLTHGKNGTETRTDNLTDITTPNLEANTENIFYGFNSTNGVPTGEQRGTETGTNTVTHTGTEQRQYDLTETDSGTETTVRDGKNETTFNTTDSDTGTQTMLYDGSDKNTRNYQLTRSGNIGVTTSQQMIEDRKSVV